MLKVRKKIFFIILVLFLIPSFVFAKKSNDPFLEQWAYEDVGLYEAWNYTTGSKEVVVAVIDNGFDTMHPDLKDNLWINKKEIANNNIDNDENGYIDDVNGWNFFENTNNIRTEIESFTDEDFENGIFNHATYVAGIIGAKGNNEFAGSGLNWNVSLMNLKVVSERGSGALDQLEEAIYYAVNNGAHIINISIVGNDANEEDKIVDAVNYAYDHGVLIVAAAGNDYYNLDENQRYPVCADIESNEEKILGVSAMAKDHRLAMFSNIGKSIDITAPGVNISSTLFFRLDSEEEKIFKNKLNGTSFATPFISGAAALIKSINFDWTAKDIIKILKDTVHHTRGQDENDYNNLFGAGLLKINNAVKYAINKKNDLFKNKMYFIDIENGEYQKQLNSKESLDLEKNDLLKNAKEILLTKINNEDIYLVFKEKEENYSVLFFDLDFNFIKEKEIKIKGDYNIDLADVYGNSNPEIIFSPKFKTDFYIKIFDLNSRYIKTYKKDTIHDSAFIKSIKNTGQKDFLSLVYKQDDKVFVEELDKDFNILDSFEIENFYFDDFLITNVDTDYEEEYIFSSKIGDISEIFIVNNGELERDFRVFPFTYKKGFNMFLFDYNHDNKEDLILTTKDNNLIRIFDFDSNRITEWNSFTNNLLFTKTN